MLLALELFFLKSGLLLLFELLWCRLLVLRFALGWSFATFSIFGLCLSLFLFCELTGLHFGVFDTHTAHFNLIGEHGLTWVILDSNKDKNVTLLLTWFGYLQSESFVSRRLARRKYH